MSKLEETKLVGDNLMQRGSHVLESGLCADCKFLVGEDKDEIQACRLLLAIASPVFEAMLHGGMASTVAVEVPDIEPKIFKQLLKYIYCHRVELSSIEEAFAVFSAADKYMMPDLCDLCVSYMQHVLVARKSCPLWLDALNFACLYKNEDLKQFVLLEMEDNGFSPLIDDGQSHESPTPSSVVKLDAESLIAVLQQDYLNVGSEVEVIKAVTRWVCAYCHKMDQPSSNMRDILMNTGIRRHIRFLTLTYQELEDGPLKSGILTQEEATALLDYKCRNDARNLPENLCPIGKRVLKHTQDKTFTIFGVKKRVWEVKEGEEFTACLRADNWFPGQLRGLTLESQVYDGQTMLCYDEDIKVFVHIDQQCYGVGQYTRKAKYNSNIHVPLNFEQRMAEKFYRLEIKVKYCKSGKYQLYSNNTSTDEKIKLENTSNRCGDESISMAISYYKP